MKRALLLFLASAQFIACGQQQRSAPATVDAAPANRPVTQGKAVSGGGQLTEYVRRIFQDSKGNTWYGSNGDGVYRYSPGTRLLEVFSTDEGLAGYQVTGIIEDRKGNIWITTNGGVSRYDPSAVLDTGGRAFTNYTKQDGLPGNGCWSILEAHDGTIWVGTSAGPCRFDGTRFVPFALPTGIVPVTDVQGHWTSCITQDRSGAIWFATRDTGVFIYQPSAASLKRFTNKNGLPDNEVACILVDSKQRVWISTMSGGIVVVEDGRVVKSFTAPTDIGNAEVWTVIEDREGRIWFSSEGYGVYRYDGKTLRNYSAQQGLGVRAVQTIHQDKGGKMWFGGGGGLYRLDGEAMVQVQRNGPW